MVRGGGEGCVASPARGRTGKPNTCTHTHTQTHRTPDACLAGTISPTPAPRCHRQQRANSDMQGGPTDVLCRSGTKPLPSSTCTPPGRTVQCRPRSPMPPTIRVAPLFADHPAAVPVCEFHFLHPRVNHLWALGKEEAGYQFCHSSHAQNHSAMQGRPTRRTKPGPTARACRLEGLSILQPLAQ